MKKFDSDVIFILVANLTTLFGVIFLSWNLFSVLFLYWVESAIIGFYNIFKMAICPIALPGFVALENIENSQIKFLRTLFLKIFMIPFFIMHYGGFMMGHLLFIYLVSFSSYIFENNGQLPNLSNQIILSYGMFVPILMLFFSHGYSFLKNFIAKKEYLKTSVTTLMTAPYKRIILMHFTLLFGGMISMFIASIMQYLNTGASLKIILTSVVISIFVILKTFVDIKAHSKEHSSLYLKQ